MQLLKTLTIIFILFLLSFRIAAKTSNISVSYSNIKIEDKAHSLYDDHLHLQIEYYKAITEKYSVGGNIGYGIYEEWLWEHTPEQSTTSTSFIEYKSSISYGINARIHLLSYFERFSSSNNNFYLKGNVGGITMLSDEAENIVPFRKNYFTFDLSSGFCWYGRNNVGLFIELGYKYYNLASGVNSRFGISFKL